MADLILNNVIVFLCTDYISNKKNFVEIFFCGSDDVDINYFWENCFFGIFLSGTRQHS
jgi:hypothetical protein